MRGGKPFSVLLATLALANIFGPSRYSTPAIMEDMKDEWRSPPPGRPSRHRAKGPRSRRRKHRSIKAKRRWKSG